MSGMPRAHAHHILLCSGERAPSPMQGQPCVPSMSPSCQLLAQQLRWGEHCPMGKGQAEPLTIQVPKAPRALLCHGCV